MVVSVIIRDTNNVKNRFFELVLGKDSILSLTLATKTEKTSFQTQFELKTIIGLSSLFYIYLCIEYLL